MRIPLAMSKTTVRPGMFSRVLITSVKASKRGLVTSCQSLAVWGSRISKLSSQSVPFLTGDDLLAVAVPKKERKRPRRVPAMLLTRPAISVAMVVGSVGSWRAPTGGRPALMASVAFLNEEVISTMAPLMAATGASISASLENGLICSTFASIGRR